MHITIRYVLKKPAMVMIALVYVLPTFAQQSESNYTHATFQPGKRSIENLIKFPKADLNGELAVICSSKATAKGRLRDARCSSPQDPDLKFTMAVSRRFNSSRVIPATVNGRKEEVDFQFTVVFSKVDGQENIFVRENNGKNIERLGNDYTSAQRYSPNPFPVRCSGWRRDDLIVEVAVVQKNGRAKAVEIMSSTAGADARCQDALETQLKNARWIPAKLDGEFVESVWVNPIVLNKLSFKREQKQE